MEWLKFIDMCYKVKDWKILVEDDKLGEDGILYVCWQASFHLFTAISGSSGSGQHGDDVDTVYRRLAFLQPAPTYPPRIREHNERQCISRVSTCVESSQNKKRDINPVQREEFILNPAPALSTNQPASDFLVWASLWTSQSHLPWYMAFH